MPMWRCACFILCGLSLAPVPSVRAESPLSEADALKIATEAYIYGYPLVTMEITRRVMTNVASPKDNHAPMGQFYHSRTYPDASFRDVTAPNADTLYSTAWLNLAKEPYVLSIPAMKGRYFLMPLLSGWTNVFRVPGKRTTGAGAQQYAITGPGWQGTLPAGLKQYKAPTNLVWILGQIYSSGAAKDFEKVHALQDQLKLVPLSAYGRAYRAKKGKVNPAIDMKTPVRDQVNRLDAASYFKLLAQLLKSNPPAKADAPIVESLAKIGLTPGEDFDIGTLEPAVARALERAPKAGVEAIMAHAKQAGTQINGWTFSLKTGTYGTDYLQRAYIAAVGLGANRPKDAVYPLSEVDSEAKPYSGANKYVLNFPDGLKPPARAFWSLTMYDEELFFVPNKLDRRTLSSRSDFKYNPDSSLDLYIQKDSPGEDKESNWLPAPPGKFKLMLRIYWPKETLLDGDWAPPAVKRVD